MPLQQGAVQGYDFNRMVVEFAMLNQSKVIFCAISTASIMRRSAAFAAPISLSERCVW